MAGGMARHERLCPLILSLYGHPDAGGYWEKHCETHLGKVGFTPIPEWRSCFWHDELNLMLTVYVASSYPGRKRISLRHGEGFLVV